MPVGWFLAPYKRRDTVLRDDAGTTVRRFPGRYCSVDDFRQQIVADGGDWLAAECPGNEAVVKVRASSTTLTAIGQTAGVLRIPSRFTDPNATLGNLTSGERNTLLARLQALGYTTQEISAALGSNLTGWRQRTLGQVLRFVLTRRLKPRYDAGSDSIVLDGPVQPTAPLEALEQVRDV
jgi:hypothetical protein